MYLTLNEYLKIASNMINKYGYSSMRGNEDAISHVATYLMKADSRYDQSTGAGTGTREGFRASWGKFGILNWINLNKKKTVSLEDVEPNIASNDNVMSDIYLNEILEYLEKLDGRQQKCIKLYYFEGKTLEEISLEFDISKERIRQIIRAGLDKIKHKFTHE